jgi:hypothetical protein
MLGNKREWSAKRVWQALRAFYSMLGVVDQKLRDDHFCARSENPA